MPSVDVGTALGNFFASGVAELREKHPGGRPPEPAIAVLVRRVEKQLDGAESPRLLASRTSLDAEQRRDLEARLRAAEGRLARLREGLRG